MDFKNRTSFLRGECLAQSPRMSLRGMIKTKDCVALRKCWHKKMAAITDAPATF